MKAKLFCVDPSIRACGWSMFSYNQKKKTAKYENSGFVKSKGIEDGDDPVIDSLRGRRSKANDWISRLDETVEEVLLHSCDAGSQCLPHIGLIELPSTYSGGSGDVASASGAIMKLMGVVFSFRERLIYESNFDKVILVPVITWKGQTKKEITARRVLRNWPCQHITDHNEMDAVGIGDWYLRRYLKYKPQRK